MITSQSQFDENMINRCLISTRLKAAGHGVVLADDAGFLSVYDARVLAWAFGQNRPVLTRDHEDFGDLHDLVLACANRCSARVSRSTPSERLTEGLPHSLSALAS